MLFSFAANAANTAFTANAAFAANAAAQSGMWAKVPT
uniref:Uncharacterized protein n=1 Tax=Siphoviridae sp. ctpnN3 TaxID=2825677 RepID=A0A8S5QDK3_9CAUD|nr:MAG TPA: hypothetical protein [Siphoviridae sp. ctpnN3]